MYLPKRFLLLLCMCVLSLSSLYNHHQLAQAKATRKPFRAAAQTAAAARTAYGQLPLSFEANAGQTDPRVKFLARGNGYGFFLTDDEAVLRLGGAAAAESTDVLRMRLRGANPQTRAQATDTLPGENNYFVGHDSRAWRTGVKSYARVKYAEVYPGIELVWYGNQRQLEHDFLIAPGADVRRIAWQLAGARRLQLDSTGALIVRLAGGTELRWLKPQAWQTVNGKRRAVACDYVLRTPAEVAF